MKIRKVWAVFFSPAGSTKRIVMHMAACAAEALEVPAEVYDYTLPQARTHAPSFGEEELVVFGTPVYAGRVPNLMLPYVASVMGSHTPVIPVAVYGNRSYQDALSELRITFAQNGFIPVGAAAMTARHSMVPAVAEGRPSAEDLEQAGRFAARIAADLREVQDPSGFALAVPGNDPIGPYYRPLGEDGQPVMFLKAKPKTKDSCRKCGICAAACPMGSISREDPSVVNGVCIKCHACVAKCPAGAKYFDDENLLSHLHYIEKHFRDVRREPEFFYAEKPAGIPEQ